MAELNEILGNERIKEHFITAVHHKKISHAYIMEGDKGSGKKMLAEAFSKILQCEGRETTGLVESCGKCESCIQMEYHDHPDVIWVSHEKPNVISVGEIREQIVNTVEIMPYKGPYKIYIVDEAEKMNAAAQNAILKTIEEPPQYAVFILLTENADVLLPTINSRCVMLKLRYIKDALIKKYLMERMEVPDYKAEVCAAFAQGNLGKAIKLAGSEHFNELKDEVLNLMRHINEMDISELVEAVKRCTLYKVEINDYLDLIMVWYRDVLLYKATREIDKVVFKDQIDCMREQARRSSYEGIETILDSLDKAKARLKANVNFDLVMELLFLTIKEN